MDNGLIDVESLLSNVSILEYISQYAEFEKKGSEYWCNSPLNTNDLTPSFSVNVEKQIFYCFDVT